MSSKESREKEKSKSKEGRMQSIKTISNKSLSLKEKGEKKAFSEKVVILAPNIPKIPRQKWSPPLMICINFIPPKHFKLYKHNHIIEQHLQYSQFFSWTSLIKKSSSSPSLEVRICLFRPRISLIMRMKQSATQEFCLAETYWWINLCLSPNLLAR